MTFCLDSTIIKPEDKIEVKNAVIMLHGYGGDGKDISMLSLNWKRHLPNTIFICPNGHEPCTINPSGFQWFDLTKDDPKYILEESIKAENKLKKFIIRKQAIVLGFSDIHMLGNCCHVFLDTIPFPCGSSAIEIMAKGKPVLSLQQLNLANYKKSRVPELILNFFDQ